jgi:hypothetical protein
MSIQVAFDLHVFAANAVSLVPVQFDSPDPAVGKLDLSPTFHLSPPAGSMDLLQIGQIPDAWSDRYDLNRFNLANNVEFHTDSLTDAGNVNKLSCVCCGERAWLTWPIALGLGL